MALEINNPEADELARELADLTGESVEKAVTTALRAQLAKRREIARKLEVIRQIQERVAALPVLDSRTDEEILGYDEDGLPA
jgi:antitoxin VapB